MAKEEKVRIPLTKKGLAEDLDAGLTRPEMAKKYDLSEGMIKKALADVGLSKKRAAIKGYIIVPDEPAPAGNPGSIGIGKLVPSGTDGDADTDVRTDNRG